MADNREGDSLEEADTAETDIFEAELASSVEIATGIVEGTPVLHWEEICSFFRELCLFVPQLEFFGAEIAITKESFTVLSMKNHPAYPTCQPFSEETSRYLKKKVSQKREAYSSLSTRAERGAKKIKLKVRAGFTHTLFPKGMINYLGPRWIKDVTTDTLRNREATAKEKHWAHQHGYLAYRIPQYGITEENKNAFISDFEYKWLRHINSKYRKWMEDKITVKYICSEFNHCFPDYYYHIVCKNGANKVISMMDLPEGYTNTYEDIFRLVEEKKVLALKPDQGSHGDGFYKFTFEDGRYKLNYEPVTKEKVLSLLQDVQNRYLVTEYIQMHPEIARIYSGAVNTIRVIVFKKDGRTPTIGNAYMRFGSRATGAVDNMGAGGMYAKIDTDTGHFYDAKMITDNGIVPCPCHPDTGVEINGYLPNWESAKEEILAVAASVPQLEYFGFDLALTEDGIKFPEINRFPDFPAIEPFSEKTRDYLLYKLQKKKEYYGYDVHPNKSLFHLPKREQ